MPNLEGSTQGVNLPETSAAAQAAVQWVNHHGGVQGHPLQLTVCGLLTTPASDVACANSMVAANPVAILAGGVDNGDPIVKAAAAANIPYAAQAGFSPLEVSSPDSFVFSGSFPGSAYVVGSNEKTNGGKQVTTILIGAPGAVAGIHAAVDPVFSALGLGSKVLLIPPTGQADLTPTIQAATAPPTTGVKLDLAATTCISSLNAKGTLNVSSSIRFYMTDACNTAAVIKATGANIQNVYMYGSEAATNPKDPDTAIYLAAMKQYAAGTATDGYAPLGFSVVMNVYRAMLRIPQGTAITAASVTSALKATSAQPAFLGQGATLTCNGTALKQLPALCTTAFFLSQYRGSTFHYVTYTTIPAA
jgi:branched-chain amino acid transport system substrate-binding protein